MVNYYDIILGLIPTVLFGTTATAFAIGIDLNVALAVGGIAAITAVLHGLFVNSPVHNQPAENDTQTTRTPDQTTHQQQSGPVPTSD